MVKAPLKPEKAINAYIDRAPEFARPICRKLRAVILAADPNITEVWKWGPHYERNGMVCGWGAFQKHVSLAFFRGASMKDRSHLFVKEHTPAKTMRRIRFASAEEINRRIIAVYVREAVAINAAGPKVLDRTLVAPPDVRKLLRKNKELMTFFDSLSYTHRKEYIRWIEGAKKKETREQRLKKMVQMLGERIKHP